MAGYLKFVEILAREGKPRRFTFICGDQGVLVEQAVDAVRLAACTAEIDFVSLSVGYDSAARIWSEMNQFGLDSTKRRLVQVRGAERLTGWDRFDAWMLSRAIPSIHVVMVANEKSWPTNREPEARARMVRSTSAIYVECSLPKGDPERAAVEIILGWGRMDRQTASYLAARTGYDLARCRDVCRWTNRLKGEITRPVIDALTVLNPRDSYVDALVRMDRRAASMYAGMTSRNEVRTIVGQLTTKLADLERIQRAMQKALLKTPEPAQAMSSTAYLSDLPVVRVKELWQAAKFYDGRAVRRRTELLLQADEHHNEPGVLEALAAQW